MESSLCPPRADVAQFLVKIIMFDLVLGKKIVIKNIKINLQNIIIISNHSSVDLGVNVLSILALSLSSTTASTMSRIFSAKR